MAIRPLELRPRLDVLRPSQLSEHAKEVMGRVAVTWKERVGSPEGKHARKPEAGRRQIDPGEAAIRAGYEGGFNTVPTLPSRPSSRRMATDILRESNQGETVRAVMKEHLHEYGRLPLITHDNAVEPRGHMPPGHPTGVRADKRLLDD